MKKYNSVKTMVQVLKEEGPMTEREIQMTCFGYDRNRTWKSNKKYADMLRRGLSKGIIARIKTYTGNRSRFMYYVPK
jgi:hypothetical protein|tara:strand:+ start:56 stop:286 length:231 start_codon:yes stop_codon:yes gene_type:complete